MVVHLVEKGEVEDITIKEGILSGGVADVVKKSCKGLLQQGL